VWEWLYYHPGIGLTLILGALAYFPIRFVERKAYENERVEMSGRRKGTPRGFSRILLKPRSNLPPLQPRGQNRLSRETGERIVSQFDLQQRPLVLGNGQYDNCRREN